MTYVSFLTEPLMSQVFQKRRGNEVGNDFNVTYDPALPLRSKLSFASFGPFERKDDVDQYGNGWRIGRRRHPGYKVGFVESGA